MTRLALWIFLALQTAALGATAPALIDLDCSLDPTPALQQEAVEIRLRISNRSAQTLTIDPEGETRLRFVVERRAGHALPPVADPLPYEAFDVEPGETAEVVINLASAFKLYDTGPYVVRAMLLHRGRYYEAPRALLDIAPGFQLKQITSGVPGREDAVRTYTLLTLSRGRGQSIFLRIEDPVRGLSYGVHELGRVLMMNEPELQTDAEGRAHTLHQSGPTRFSHSIYTPEGRPLGQTFYTKGPGQPALRRTEDGGMEVTGVLEYEGDVSVERPQIRPFNPFE